MPPLVHQCFVLSPLEQRGRKEKRKDCKEGGILNFLPAYMQCTRLELKIYFSKILKLKYLYSIFSL